MESKKRIEIMDFVVRLASVIIELDGIWKSVLPEVQKAIEPLIVMSKSLKPKSKDNEQLEQKKK